jgi:hypothetical protein
MYNYIVIGLICILLTIVTIIIQKGRYNKMYLPFLKILDYSDRLHGFNQVLVVVKSQMGNQIFAHDMPQRVLKLDELFKNIVLWF